MVTKSSSDNTFEGISAIVCTHRKDTIGNLFSNYFKQNYSAKELIIVVNNDKISLKPYQDMAKNHPSIKVIRMPEQTSLGYCLNAGISAAKYPIIAKMDHDDYYGPNYLKETVHTMKISGAKVVGKLSHLTYIEHKKLLILRFPDLRNRYTDWVAGGTIAFRKSVFRKVRFRDISLSEDVMFARDCKKNGYPVYSGNPDSYVYVRHADKKLHTWKTSDKELLQEGGARVIAKTGTYQKYATDFTKRFPKGRS